MLRQQLAEQDIQMGTASDSLQVQLRELGEQAQAKAEVSYATRMLDC
jgi:hypothetical protein